MGQHAEIQVWERAVCIVETRREAVLVEARTGSGLLGAHRVGVLVELGPGAMRRILTAQRVVVARVKEIGEAK
jgi:hypothetical protein